MKKKMTGFYLEKELKEKIDALAEKLKISTSMLVRRVLEFAVNAFDENEKEKFDRHDKLAADMADAFKKEIVAEVVAEIKKEANT